jgi:hypothetical protein
LGGHANAGALLLDPQGRLHRAGDGEGQSLVEFVLFSHAADAILQLYVKLFLSLGFLFLEETSPSFGWKMRPGDEP